MTTSVTPVIKPEDRKIFIQVSPAEASVLSLAISTVLTTLQISAEWATALTELRDDLQTGIESIVKG
jgi:hypothetical protein